MTQAPTRIYFNDHIVGGRNTDAAPVCGCRPGVPAATCKALGNAPLRATGDTAGAGRVVAAAAAVAALGCAAAAAAAYRRRAAAARGGASVAGAVPGPDAAGGSYARWDDLLDDHGAVKAAGTVDI